MPSLPLLLSQAFNGLALGSLLALVSSGLTIILGTLGVLNFAHGALFMLGAYAAYVTLQGTGSFLLALLAGALFMLLVGVVIERGLVRLFYHRPPEDQILVTFGAGIVLVEAVRAIFGGNSQRVPVPGWGGGVTQLGFLIYPTYRLELIGIIALMLGGLWLVLYRTSIGLVVRAGIEDAGMVGILGINVRRTFLLVFALGVVAAGFAGMLYAPMVSVDPGHGRQLPGGILRGHRDRRPGVVPRRGGRRADRRRDHQHHQRIQLGLFRGDAVRGDGAAAGGAPAGAVRHRGPCMTRLPFLPELALIAALAAMPFVFPYIGGSYDLMERVLDWGLLGLGFDLLFGWTGLLSFGQAAFFGTGGFVAAWLLVNHILGSVWIALFLGTVAAGLFGLLVGYLAVRRIGIYFAMITLAFGQMAYFLENSPLSAYTGGENGLPGVPVPSLGFGASAIQIGTGLPMYWLLAAFFLAGFIVARRIAHSPFGVVLRAIKENTARAAMIGHAVPQYKLAAFVIAALYAGPRRRPAGRVPELHAAGRLRARHLRAVGRADRHRRRRHADRPHRRRGDLAVAA